MFCVGKISWESNPFTVLVKPLGESLWDRLRTTGQLLPDTNFELLVGFHLACSNECPMTFRVTAFFLVWINSHWNEIKNSFFRVVFVTKPRAFTILTITWHVRQWLINWLTAAKYENSSANQSSVPSYVMHDYFPETTEYWLSLISKIFKISN